MLKRNLKLNDKHFLESIQVKNYPKPFKQDVNTFYKLWIEYTKTNNYGYLKRLIGLSYVLGIKSALFEQISLILSKEFLRMYNRI